MTFSELRRRSAVMTKKRNMWEKLLLHFCIYLILCGLVKLLTVITWESFSHQDWKEAPLYILFFNSLVAVVTICCVPYVQSEVFNKPGFSYPISIDKSLLISLGAGFAIISSGFGLLILTGQISHIALRTELSMIITGLGYCIAVAITEGLLVRRYLLNVLLKCYGKPRALISSALFFALLDIYNPHVTPFGLLNLFTAGIILGQIYLSTHSLWLTIILQSFWNSLQGPLFGFPVEGLRLYSWIFQGKTDDSIWTGGAFGFEGSLLCFMAQLCILCLIFKPWKYRTKKSARNFSI